MSWAKFDDRYDDNRKVRRAWRRNRGAVGLHAMAITYSARHETDGLIDEDWIEDKLPDAAERESVLDVLLEAGLFEPAGEGLYSVHDYLDFNAPHAELADRRRADAERKAAARASGGQKNRARPASNGTPARRPRGVPADSAAPSARSPSDPSRADAFSRPVPSEGPPLPPEGGRGRDLKAFDAELRSYAESLLPNVDPSDAFHAVRAAIAVIRIRTEPTTESILETVRRQRPELLESAA